jgi:membrane protease YdiL (CAAX protease family)
MNSRIEASRGIGEVLVFYLVLTFIVLLSTYFLTFAFFSYFIIFAILHMLNKRSGGFRWGSSWKFGFILGLIIISSIFLLEYGLGLVRYKGLVSGAFLILAGGLIFELVVSVVEEMSFRGYILPNLMKNMGLQSAVFITSILFAALHIPSIQAVGIPPFNALIMFTAITAAGIILARLYILDGLKMAVGFHFSWNFFQYHIFSLRSGLGIFSIEVDRPEITGGLAGPEAGLTGLTALILGILILRGLSLDMRKA